MRPIQSFSCIDLAPFHHNETNCTLKILKGPINQQTYNLTMVNLHSYNKNENLFAKYKHESRFLSWLTIFNRKTFEWAILDSFEWGHNFETNKKTLSYKLHGPVHHASKLRIPNCAYFSNFTEDIPIGVSHKPFENQLSFGFTEYLDSLSCSKETF